MKVILYTRDKDFKLRPIEIGNGYNKPIGGLWASPLGSEEGWKEYCEKEESLSIADLTRVEMDLDMRNFITIDSVGDLNKLYWLPSSVPGMELLDFKQMKAEGVDGIYLTAAGQRRTRLSHPRHLYGWDCESVVVMNERAIQNYQITR